MTKFTDEFNALVKQLEELCKREGVDFLGKQLDEYGPNTQEVILITTEWQDSGCSFEYETDYWQSSRC